jgi:CRP/FNR family transcriptional regulator, cyclic AMP receptor protein
VDPTRLAAIPLFSTLPEPELAVVAGLAGEREVEKGRVLMAKDDFGHCLFAIESGTAALTHAGETIRTLGPGEVIGEVAVLAAGRRSATIVATSPMRLISFFKRDVWALDEEAPEAARRLRELIVTRTMPASS